jgi:protease secretion system membrane fusion protein
MKFGTDTPSVTTVQDKVDTDDARPRRWGWALLVLGFGGFLAWSLLAPLDAGVSVHGSVVVSGYRKPVQTLTSGKIAAILPKDGDSVKTGQLLVRLDDTQSRSQHEIARGLWFGALATEARLTAERTGRATPDFPPELRQETGDSRAGAAMALQTQLLATRRQSLASELGAMRENMRGLELQQQGTESSRRSKEEQRRLLEEELRNLRQLASEGFVPRNRVLEQDRSLAALTGAIAEDLGTIGRTQQAIAEVRMRVAAREQETRKDVESLLSDVQKEASSLRSRLEALAFDLAGAQITSPADGIVMGLAVHTVGGVVGAGSVMMEVVPQSAMLKVDAQIPPHLIDKVRPGLPVDVLFSALNQADTPNIPGRVLRVSADVLQEPRQDKPPYFKATVEVTPEGMAKLRNHQIRAGMPAEVFIRTGERTAMNYLLKPMRDRLNRALTEP